MASKRRLRRRACTSKKKHERNTAVGIAKSMRQRGKMVSAYSCKFCGGWHVGRLNKAARRSLAGRLHNNAMA